MSLEQMPQFKQAIANIESSGGNYSAMGPSTGTLGRGLGKYQIMSANWPNWARQAGIPGADWRSPEAQERVAEYKFNEYYQRFGSWELVAIAWFAGPGRAQQALEQGIDSVGNLKDVLGTSVAKYVASVRNDIPEIEPQPGPSLSARPDARALLTSVFGTLSDKIAGGKRELPPLHLSKGRPLQDATLTQPTEIVPEEPTEVVEATQPQDRREIL